MHERRFWPFPVPDDVCELEGTGSQIAFLDAARSSGNRAYVGPHGVLGAISGSGRDAEAVPRGGSRGGTHRYWEVFLSRGSHIDTSFFVDGFPGAAAGMLRWLQGEQGPETVASLGELVVGKPGERGW